MSAGASLQGEQFLIRLAGVLDFDSVPALVDSVTRELGQRERVIVDLGGVTASNSAGLALLLEMSRIMRARQGSIAFHAIPDSLERMAQACGLSDAGRSLQDILSSQGQTPTA